MLGPSGRIGGLAALLASPAGQAAQMRILTADRAVYTGTLGGIPGLTAPASKVYAGRWCLTSFAVMTAFLTNGAGRYDLNDLTVLYRLFWKDYARAVACEKYLEGYQNRADRTYACLRENV